jgi:ketosteroid isomerase-like protein
MTNVKLIEKFYTSFSEGDFKGMKECYHAEICFQDPVFGKLMGEKPGNMWEMLLSQKKANLTISFDRIDVSSNTGKAHWTAEYLYGKSKRKVTNIVRAEFKFKEGKIIEHIDTFDLWKWTKQAMGITGYLMGWTPFMKTKIQATTNKRLNDFMKNKANPIQA